MWVKVVYANYDGYQLYNYSLELLNSILIDSSLQYINFLTFKYYIINRKNIKIIKSV